MVEKSVNGLGDITLKDVLDQQKQYSGYTERSPEVKEYLNNHGIPINPATTAWCAGFLNAGMDTFGLPKTGSLLAKSFLDWGVPTTTPKVGDIAVLNRTRNPVFGHVTQFEGWTDEDEDQFNGFGGNQSNRAKSSRFSTADVAGYRTLPAYSAYNQYMNTPTELLALERMLSGAFYGAGVPEDLSGVTAPVWDGTSFSQNQTQPVTRGDDLPDIGGRALSDGGFSLAAGSSGWAGDGGFQNTTPEAGWAGDGGWHGTTPQDTYSTGGGFGGEAFSTGGGIDGGYPSLSSDTSGFSGFQNTGWGGKDFDTSPAVSNGYGTGGGFGGGGFATGGGFGGEMPTVASDSTGFSNQPVGGYNTGGGFGGEDFSTGGGFNSNGINTGFAGPRDKDRSPASPTIASDTTGGIPAAPAPSVGYSPPPARDYNMAVPKDYSFAMPAAPAGFPTELPPEVPPPNFATVTAPKAPTFAAPPAAPKAPAPVSKPPAPIAAPKAPPSFSAAPAAPQAAAPSPAAPVDFSSAFNGLWGAGAAANRQGFQNQTGINAATLNSLASAYDAGGMLTGAAYSGLMDAFNNPQPNFAANVTQPVFSAPLPDITPNNANGSQVDQWGGIVGSYTPGGGLYAGNGVADSFGGGWSVADPSWGAPVDRNGDGGWGGNDGLGGLW